MPELEEEGLEEIQDLETAEQPKDDNEEESGTEQERLFNVTNPDELPEEVQPIYKDWQKNYTQKRQVEKAQIRDMQQQMEELRNRAVILENQNQQFNQIINSPEFVEWASSQIKGQKPQTEYEPSINYDAYEDPEGVKTLMSELRNMVRSEVSGALNPVVKQISLTKEQQEFQGLVETAKANGWTDPSKIQKEINLVRNMYPNIPLTAAYEIAESRNRRSGLETRKPINGDDIKSIVKEIPTIKKGNQPTLQPSGSRFKKGSENSIERLDKIIQEKNASGKSTSRTPISQILRNVLHEKGVDENDL